MESVLSQHFGKTPVSTPFASQELCDSPNGNDEIETDDGPHDINVILEGRVRDYLSHQETVVEEDEESDDVDDTEDFAPGNDAEFSKIQKFCAEGCGCNRECAKTLSAEKVFEHILNVREMEKNAKDLYLMGILQDDRSSDVTKRGKKRQRNRYTFKFSGKEVCRRTFNVCYDIGRSALNGIMSHMLEHGAVPRSHGNMGRRPKHALCFDDAQRVVAYILSCAEREGIPLPAAPRGRDNIPPTYLPASTTKLDLFQDYQQNCASDIRSVKLTAFKSIWSSCVPHIRIASPRDDV